MVLRQVDRWKNGRWIPQVGGISQGPLTGTQCAVLLMAPEEAGTGGLLGLHQLLQALQHRQTQGLKLHGQFDYFSLFLFF